MGMIFCFTMLSDENDNFVRDFEVEYDMPLVDFHKYICANLKYDADEMASFFTADKAWEKMQEYTLFDMGEADSDEELAPLPMESVLLSNIIHDNHDRLIYVFDFIGDRAMYLELMAARPRPTETQFPRCVTSEGDAPGQFAADTVVDGGSGSIFDDIMSDFNDFEGDDNYDDDY